MRIDSSIAESQLRDYQARIGKTDTLAASLDRIQKTAADIIAALHAPEEQAHTNDYSCHLRSRDADQN